MYMYDYFIIGVAIIRSSRRSPPTFAHYKVNNASVYTPADSSRQLIVLTSIFKPAVNFNLCSFLNGLVIILERYVYCAHMKAAFVYCMVFIILSICGQTCPLQT